MIFKGNFNLPIKKIIISNIRHIFRVLVVEIYHRSLKLKITKLWGIFNQTKSQTHLVAIPFQKDECVRESALILGDSSSFLVVKFSTFQKCLSFAKKQQL